MTCVTPEFRVSPLQCNAPQPSGARLSQARSGSPHGQKLYHLYVSNPAAYTLASDGIQDAPIGLTLVKEAHYLLDQQSSIESGFFDEQREGQLFPGPVAELFIMSKVGEADTPETDQGWVYSVADSEGTVSVSGLISSCMKCHEDSTNDRLFGLAPATTIYWAYPSGWAVPEP